MQCMPCHALHCTVRALTKCAVVRLALESNFFFSQTFAIFAIVMSKCGIPDRLEDGGPACQQKGCVEERRTRRESASASELTQDFRTFVGPVAPVGTQGSLSLDHSGLLKHVMMTQKGQINSAGSVAGAMLRQ